MGAGSLSDGAAAAGASPLGDDAVATDGDGVGAGSLGEGAAVVGDAVATDGDVGAPGAGAGSFAEAEEASSAGVDPLIAAAIAQAGVGAGSLSESVDVSAGDVAAPVATVGAVAVMSAEAIGIGESEAKAAAPSAIAETRRTLWVIKTSLCDTRRCAPRENSVASPTCKPSDRSRLRLPFGKAPNSVQPEMAAWAPAEGALPGKRSPK